MSQLPCLGGPWDGFHLPDPPRPRTRIYVRGIEPGTTQPTHELYVYERSGDVLLYVGPGSEVGVPDYVKEQMRRQMEQQEQEDDWDAGESWKQ